MSAGNGLIGTLVFAAAFAATIASAGAQELPAPAVQAPDMTLNTMSELPPVPAVTPAEMPAAIPARQDVAAMPMTVATPVSLPGRAAPMAQDGLHRDPRWPLFRNCIENTFSPQAFEACLQQAFLTDTTGNSAALMPK